MIAVDSSALIAIVTKEVAADAFIRRMNVAEQLVISAGTLIEVRMVAHNKGGPALVEQLNQLIDAFDFEIAPPTKEQADIAHAAFVTYGKGSGHKAQLNYGDLFSYALAKSRGVPLLFKGDDFAATDVQVAA